MALESIGVKTTEYEMADIIKFSPKRGVSPNMIKAVCDVHQVKYSFHFGSTIEELRTYTEKGFFPIVLIKPSVLYNLSESEHGHYIIVKYITDKGVIINDPDQEFGGENKLVGLDAFVHSWNNKFRLIFVLEGV